MKSVIFYSIQCVKLSLASSRFKDLECIFDKVSNCPSQYKLFVFCNATYDIEVDT